ncbi:MAG: hypothetical protein K0Q67_1836 [Cellvibrio sp.]|jgi:hypothetical protein|nr:hypothetical protein [Cellvibrio sp.]
MKLVKVFLSVIFVLHVSGCAVADCKPEVGRVLPGTNTAVVGIFLDKDGIPKETVKEVIVHPGQNVLYAGPDEFKIVFKNKKAPNRVVSNSSKDGVVLIKIPKNIFERKEFVEEFRKNNSLVFDYSIWVNGKEYDPPIRVVPF